jgi:IS30 family transposase
MPYNHLSKEERKCIHRWRIEEVPVGEMAQLLARSRSTIYRELRRNALGPNSYVGEKAHTLYRKRIRWLRRRLKQGHRALMDFVRRKLKARWSPEQIADTLRIIFPDCSRMQISTITIYRFVGANKAGGGTLYRYLRHSRKKKRKRYGSNDKRGHLIGRTFIDERPAIVDIQARYGDWEGDTMCGCTKGEYLATFVERKTLYTIVRKMKDHSAAELLRAARSAFKDIPSALRKTLTVDNGKEFACFRQLQEQLGFDVYFAHPYASWERGINENINGLLRQYVPKKTAFESYSHQYIAAATKQLNHRPRKKLEYRTPHEVFWGACRT